MRGDPKSKMGFAPRASAVDVSWEPISCPIKCVCVVVCLWCAFLFLVAVCNYTTNGMNKNMQGRVIVVVSQTTHCSEIEKHARKPCCWYSVHNVATKRPHARMSLCRNFEVQACCSVVRKRDMLDDAFTWNPVAICCKTAHWYYDFCLPCNTQ